MCWKHLSYLWVELQVPSPNSSRREQKKREVDKEKVSCKYSQTTAFLLLSALSSRHHCDVCPGVRLVSPTTCVLFFKFFILFLIPMPDCLAAGHDSQSNDDIITQNITAIWGAEANRRLWNNKKKRGDQKKKREKKKCKTAMFGVILSPGPDVVLALLFRSLCRENTLWSRQFEWLWASAKTRLRLAFLTVCLVLRVSELGRFTIENPVKGFSRKCAWNVTRRGWRN